MTERTFTESEPCPVLGCEPSTPCLLCQLTLPTPVDRSMREINSNRRVPRAQRHD